MTNRTKKCYHLIQILVKFSYVAQLVRQHHNAESVVQSTLSHNYVYLSRRLMEVNSMNKNATGKLILELCLFCYQSGFGVLRFWYYFCR